MLLSIPSPSSPYLFQLGPLGPRWYGVLLACGVLIGGWLARREIRAFMGILVPAQLSNQIGGPDNYPHAITLRAVAGDGREWRREANPVYVKLLRDARERGAK